jgi:MoxR-like ATPase
MPTLTYTLNKEDHRVVLADLTRIGRADDNDVCVVHESLSRRHAVVRKDHDGFRLIDEGSQNGVSYRGQRITSLALEDGMIFNLGDVAFRFSSDAEPAPPVLTAPPTPVPEPPFPKPSAEGKSAPPAPPPVLNVEEPSAPPTEEKAELAEASAAPPVVQEAGTLPEAALTELSQAKEKILAQISKVIVGQKEVLNEIMVALFARGHCLMIGVPGLAKTLMVKTLAQAVELQGNRIQFTPDLMPSDITGTDILEEDPHTGKREFRFHKGPLFTNLLLADEINRTPPKTQAALLEAMQERRVTAAGKTYDLPDPFMVMATQNPIEQEGTYPLPEAQLDRFMFCILLKYPSADDERRVLLETTRDAAQTVQKALDGPAILRFQHLVRQVPVSEHVALYAMNLIRATRPDTEGVPDFIKRWVRWGAGTRAGQYLLLAAKAHVLMQGRFSVSCADVRLYALPVLRHRMFCNFAAASEGVSTDDIVKKTLEAVKEPTY